MKTVAIIELSGFVGTKLVVMFESHGYKVLRISQSMLKKREDFRNYLAKRYNY